MDILIFLTGTAWGSRLAAWDSRLGPGLGARAWALSVSSPENHRQHGEHDADDQARHDREIERRVAALDDDVAGQAAEGGTMRKDFGTSIERNATHGSDAPETAAFELGYFFRGMEI